MPRRHVLLALLVVVIWGVNFVVVEIGLESFPPFLFVALRYLLTVLPAVFLVPRPRARLRHVIAVGLFLGVGQFGLLFLGMSIGMPPGLSSLVLQCQAIFTVAFGLVVIKERPTPHQVVGLLVAASGIVVIAVSRGGRTDLLPLLLVIGAGVSWGAGNIATRIATRSAAAQPAPVDGAGRDGRGRLGKRAGEGFRLLIWSSLVPPLPLLGLSLGFEGPQAIGDALSTLSWSGVGALLYLVVLATMVGFGIWVSLLQRYPAAAVAPFSMLVPIVGITTAWLVYDERMTLAEVVGGALVLLGLAVLNRLVGGRR
ncbi:MAG: EamA family transporter [Streptosporangiales bacterium]|nr:EamA family transporter [Streptosporangiales bacterium]